MLHGDVVDGNKYSEGAMGDLHARFSMFFFFDLALLKGIA